MDRITASRYAGEGEGLGLDGSHRRWDVKQNQVPDRVAILA